MPHDGYQSLRLLGVESVACAKMAATDPGPAGRNQRGHVYAPCFQPPEHPTVSVLLPSCLEKTGWVLIPSIARASEPGLVYFVVVDGLEACLLYTSPSPRD